MRKKKKRMKGVGVGLPGPIKNLTSHVLLRSNFFLPKASSGNKRLKEGREGQKRAGGKPRGEKGERKDGGISEL